MQSRQAHPHLLSTFYLFLYLYQNMCVCLSLHSVPALSRLHKLSVGCLPAPTNSHPGVRVNPPGGGCTLIAGGFSCMSHRVSAGPNTESFVVTAIATVYPQVDTEGALLQVAPGTYSASVSV